MNDAVGADGGAADRARGAQRYLAKVARSEQKARRDQAAPEALTEAVLRRNAAAQVCTEVTQAAAAAGARQQAEAELGAHMSRLAVLEDAAVAAEQAAASPPDRVPPSMWTALLAHPLQLLLCPDLGRHRAGAGQRPGHHPGPPGRCRRRAARPGPSDLEAEQADRARHPAQLQALGNGNIGVIPNPLHPSTPHAFDPAPGGRGQPFVPPPLPRLG